MSHTKSKRKYELILKGSGCGCVHLHVFVLDREVLNFLGVGVV